MKKRLMPLLVSCLLLLGFGCSRSAPSCGDDRTKALVIKIATKEAKRQLKNTTSFREDRTISDAQWEKEWAKILPQITFELENIRIKDFNKNIGTYQCAATLKFTIKGKKKEVPISYTSELAQDKEGGFYVEVFGLH